MTSVINYTGLHNLTGQTWLLNINIDLNNIMLILGLGIINIVLLLLLYYILCFIIKPN